MLKASLMKKYTTILTSAIFTLGIFGVCTFSACSKNDCINDAIQARHKNDICPTNCPGVTGCDGKKYCNLCEANKNGVAYLR